MDLRLENLGKRGIIHTTSYALTEQLEQRYLLDTPVLPEIIFHTRKKNIDELLAIYKQTPGAVLFTPSLTEGFDGEGDLLEWQVLVKCPFPSLGDPRIKAFIKSKFGTTLFNERTVSTLIQTLGRGIRSSTDTCTSYILDRNASRLINKCCSTEGAHAHSVPHYMKTIWKDREIREQL
jgi:Rad3-related DNA helicase